ncbi:hypothetical protein AKJ09_10181 [Labilithrix luteola]|uniref:Uncharacterized protein n=1 Tax=Labilithrix luteola TaxID=1391654 RepID=A0A0K1QCR2_9BACT|nr:MopE-related protein [Labilithrix luteola]AKV03518.1 hypothetical protein AKJ09_10181 [Labilithrix luteola]
MSSRVRTSGIVAIFVGAFVTSLLHAGCGKDSPDLFVQPYDAGLEADAVTPDATPDLDPTLGGPCSEDSQCDDAIPCTFDRCDLTLSRCRNVPDDTVCADDVYCNGQEKCVLRIGCTAGSVMTCQDDSPCTIDRCVEATKTCEHSPRDVDGDGDPDNHCVGSRDCDDTDPTVSSLHAEVCGNFKDDNCDGQIDETPCVKAQSDVCETAFEVTTSGTYLLTSVGSKKDYATTCSVKTPAAAQDVVVAATAPGAPGGPPSDIAFWVTAQSAANEVAIALQSTCGQTASETSCGHVAGVANARAIARSVPAGSKVYAIVTTQREGPVDVKVDFSAPTSAPTNETCDAPVTVIPDVPFVVSLVDAKKDLPSGCLSAKTGELTYAFTLDTPRDVKIFASTIAGSGQPMVTMRDVNCATDELRCRVGPTPPVFARSLPAGTHVFAVAGTSQLDASVVVKTFAPTPTPPNQSCSTAPKIDANGSVTVDLGGQEDAIKNGCFPGGPAAAYELTLTEASDVLVIGRFGPNDQGAVSLNTAACTPSNVVACTSGLTPVRISKRNLPPGSYRVVIADALGQNARLDVLVRKATAPTPVSGADDCAAPGTIDGSGGFYTGDTTNATANFSAACDSPGQPIGGANDQVMRLDLAAPKRVVFDMSGSLYTTLLDIRQGSTCPGIEVPDACYVGAGGGRSFLDTKLAAGTYWVQIDGFAGDHGPWNLDVRVLPP